MPVIRTMSAALGAAAMAVSLPSSVLAQEGAADLEAPSEPPSLTLEQQTLLRCSAAFAIVSAEQDRGEASALAYPPMQQRGQEYFVRAGARLMDELSLSREAVQQLFQAEAQSLQERQEGSPQGERLLSSVRGPCLLSLEASGL